MSITEKQKNTYIEAGGVCCPFCGSSDIEGQSVEVDAGRATQSMGCLACHREWTDQYVLADVIPAEHTK